MSKLSAKQVQDILDKRTKGVSVSILAREYFVTKMVIYYHIKTKGVYYVPHPNCYNDYLKNQIFRLQLKAEESPKDKKRILAEIQYIKDSIQDLHKCSADPFIIQ